MVNGVAAISPAENIQAVISDGLWAHESYHEATLNDFLSPQTYKQEDMNWHCDNSNKNISLERHESIWQPKHLIHSICSKQ